MRQRIELIPSPKQQRQLLPSLLSLSFFYAEPVYISVQLRVEQLPVSDISQIFCLPLQLLYTQDDLTRAGHTRHLLRQSDTCFKAKKLSRVTLLILSISNVSELDFDSEGQILL